MLLLLLTPLFVCKRLHMLLLLLLLLLPTCIFHLLQSLPNQNLGR